LKDKTLVFITLPPLAQNLPNDRLCEIVQGKLSQVFPGDSDKVSVEVGQGIVYLKGLVKNYTIQRAMENCVSALPKVRGCVNFTRLQVSSQITDRDIENSIYDLLESPAMHLFDYKVNVSGGKVQIQSSCYENERPKDLENRLGEIPGVRDLVCLVTELSDPMNVELCKELETDLSTNALLRGAYIRVSCNNRKFLLEGHVQSTFQKQLALFTLLKKTKTTAVENRLRLI
jgi:osmotically-inducible protein OsmY